MPTVFGEWDVSNIEVKDPALKEYIRLDRINILWSGGRFQKNQFAKLKMGIIERLANRIMTSGLRGSKRKVGFNNGKKEKAYKIIRNAFRIIHAKTGKNPIQVLVDAIVNAAPREGITRIAKGGNIYNVSVDISSSRRIDLALRFIAEAMWLTPDILSAEERLANILILTANNDLKSHAISRKVELERVAMAAR